MSSFARRVAIAIAGAAAACHHAAPPTAMPDLVTAPQPADAEPIPGGVAAPDGGELYLQITGGIDAIDPVTGAIRWHTDAATVPVLATPDVLLAFAATSEGDQTWNGAAQLVAIDRAPPHAARTGPAFSLPLERGHLLDARVDGKSLSAWWYAAGVARSALVQPPAPVLGSLRIDLASGAATIDRTSWVPDAVTAAIAGQTLWSPPERGAHPWRAGDGWSVVALDEDGGGRAPTLRHWPAAGDERRVRLVETGYLTRSNVVAVDRHHLFLRVCEPATGAPSPCALRVFDATTGAAVATLDDDPAPPPFSPAPRFAFVGPTLLAVDRATSEVIAADGKGGPARWRRPLLTVPFRLLPP